MTPLEEMASFFNSRVDTYDEHMLKDIDGAEEFYIETARLIPTKPGLKLLDLGCGTGLELDEIFKINPSVQVTGIDLAEEMIRKLKQKHADRGNQLNLVIADYFEYDFGENAFDAVLSVQTLHHFTHEEKIELYKKVRRSLRHSGVYVEVDYMSPTQEYEDSCFAENKRIRAEMGVTEGLYHFDTPCTVENQITMLKTAGFSPIEIVRRYSSTYILAANAPGPPASKILL